MNGFVVNKPGLRLSRIVVELRKNRYPNCTSFVRLLAQCGYSARMGIDKCCKRTILRDLDLLKYDYGAPIEFDHVRKGYYLTDRNWKFTAPLLTGNFALSTMLGASLAKKMMPSPIRDDIDIAVTDHVASNGGDLQRIDFIDTLLVAAGTKADVSPEVFRVVFDGWRRRQALDIVHKRSDGTESSRRFEPQVLAYHKGIWYVKGRCLQKQETRLFAVHRIVSATLTPEGFDTDDAMVEEVERNGLFDYPKLKNVKVHCVPSICGWIREQASAKKLVLEDQPDGSLLVTMPEAHEYEALRFVLGECGKVKILEPLSLAQKALEAGREIVRVHEAAGTQPTILPEKV